MEIVNHSLLCASSVIYPIIFETKLIHPQGLSGLSSFPRQHVIPFLMLCDQKESKNIQQYLYDRDHLAPTPSRGRLAALFSPLQGNPGTSSPT
jgi:hypothetical protein